MSRHSTETASTLIGLMRESNWTMRSIASVVILTFGGLVTSPAVAAVAQEAKQIQWHKPKEGNAAKLSKKVEETHTFLTKLAAHDTKNLDLAASHDQLRALKSDLESLDKDAMDDFAANEAHIQAHNLPAAIEQRQQAAVKTYRDRMDTLQAELKAADEAKDSATFMAHVNKAKTHLDAVQVKPFHAKLDPANLPFSVAKPTGAKPRLSKKDYQARPVAPPKRAQVAANGSLAGILTAADVTGTLPTNPADPSYLAATDDVQITLAIQAQATVLHDDPVQIYNWVHNNIEYIPTYGSIQGSDMTLQTLKGNDFDQASLLIALLRASNIPSRYVYGTIQVPIAQVENWVGGVTDPNAALNLMSQGGIPVTGLVQGGQIKYAQLEHVWVEAWVNFIPSRGARPGPGNTWIPMDASFKQYIYTQGTNFQQALPFDSSTLSQASTSTQFNAADNSIQNMNLVVLQQSLLSYQQKLTSYITSLGQSVTFSQLIGNQVVLQRNVSSLSSSLPYQVLRVGEQTASLADQLRDKFAYSLSDTNGNQLVSYTASTPDLASHLLALSFGPATQSDQEILDSYLPQPVLSGSTTTPGNLPATLPGYLINVIPEIMVDGKVVSTGNPIPLGSALQVNMNYWDPQNGWNYQSKSVISGEFHAVGLDLQGISSGELSNLQGEIEAVSQNLANGDTSNITKQSLVGNRLHATILGYFLVNDVDNVVAARQSNAVVFTMPSYGDFSNTISPNTTFGVPVSVSYPGYTMDIRHAQNTVSSKDNSAQATIKFNQVIGARYSTLEGMVPEQIVNNSTAVDAGVTTVSALSQAMADGQTIYSIDSGNAATTLPLLQQPSDVLQDIQSAIGSGMQVTISQSPVTLDSWTGTGYMIFDPATGIGQYEISGGALGGFSTSPIAIGDGFATMFETPNQGLPKNLGVEGSELKLFGNCFSFLSAIASFTQLLNEGCNAGAAAYMAGADAVFSFLMTEALTALIAVLPVFPLAGLFLMLVGIILIGYLMDKLTELEGSKICGTMPNP